MSELYSVHEARLILSINTLDIAGFQENYEKYKGDSISEDTSDRIMETLNRIKLEGMADEPEDKRLSFLNQCIDLIELPAKKKKYYKLFAKFNSREASLEEKDSFVSEMKGTCPVGREKELLMLELTIANTRLDFKRIEKVLGEINALPPDGSLQGG